MEGPVPGRGWTEWQQSCSYKGEVPESQRQIQRLEMQYSALRQMYFEKCQQYDSLAVEHKTLLLEREMLQEELKKKA